MPAGGHGGSTRRARRSCGRWWRSGTIARWTNTAEQLAARSGRAAGQPADAVPRPAAARAVAQKKTLRASEQDRADIQAERAVFCERVRQLDAKDLVFIDESGITTAMTRLYARAPRGERARGSAPCGWRRLTVLGALSGEGMVAAMSIAGGHDHAGFSGLLTGRADPRTAPPPSQRHRADGQFVRAQAEGGRELL